jgi:Tfp pilus assembly protein PilO
MTQAAVHSGHVLWTLKRGLLRLGSAGLIGLVLILLALGVLLLGVQPMQQRIAALDAEQSRLSSQLRTRGPQRFGSLGVREQLVDFYAFFPSTEQIPQLLDKIQHAARDQRLTLAQGDYKLSRDPGFPVQRYQASLPVMGQYAQVRSFVNAVLDTVPNAALDELILERDDIGDRQLEARVRFTLFVRVPQ